MNREKEKSDKIINMAKWDSANFIKG